MSCLTIIKLVFTGEELDDSDSNINKSVLNDELSDISDEDFHEANAANNARSKKVRAFLI